MSEGFSLGIVIRNHEGDRIIPQPHYIQRFPAEEAGAQASLAGLVSLKRIEAGYSILEEDDQTITNEFFHHHTLVN